MKRKKAVILVVLLLLMACNSKTSQEYLDEAKSLIAENNLEKAFNSLEKSVARDSSTLEAYLIMADIERQKRNYYRAIGQMSTYEKHGGDKATYLKTIGDIYANDLGNGDIAIPYYQDLLNYTDDKCTWWNVLGNLCYYNNMREDALNYLKEAFRQDCLEKEYLSELYALTMDYKDYINDENKISLKYPTHWRTREVKKPGMYFVEFADDSTGCSFNLTIGSDQGGSLSDWKTMIDNELKKDNATVLQNITKTIMAGNCNYVSSRYINKELAVIVNNYVLLKNGNAYMMNFAGPEGIVQDFKDIENEIVNSIKIE